MSQILVLVVIGVVVCSIALFFLDDIRTSRMGESTCAMPSQCGGTHDDCTGKWTCVDGDCVWKCNALPITPPLLPNTCLDDADCATGGCSSEVCGLKEDVEGIMTICIYQNSYECLKLTECGCVDGACKWKENDDYLACMSPYMN